MAVPEVRVRLSAEGEAQVVAALRKVQSEAQRTSGAATRSFNTLNSSLAGLRTLLIQVGAVIAVGKLIEFAKSATSAADAVGKMSQAVGASVRNVSALRAVALTANVSLEQLQAGLTIFNRRATEALGGNEVARKSFKALGISLDQIKGKDAAERVALVAAALEKMKDSPEKVALGFQFFGRQIAALIPFLNDLGAVGLQGAIDKAQELGIAFSEDTARAAQALNDDFAIMNAQVQSIAANFVEGLAPAAHEALTGTQDDLADISKAMRNLGAEVGKNLTLVFLALASTLDQISLTIFKTINGIVSLGKAIAGVLTQGPFAGAAVLRARNEALEQNLALEKAVQERQKEREEAAVRAGFVAAEVKAGRGAQFTPPVRAGQGEQEPPIVPEKPTGKTAEQLAFEAAILRFKSAQNDSDFEAAKIQAQIAAGVQSQVLGNRQLLELDKQRLPTLRRLAVEALKAAQALSGPERDKAIEQANELARSVEILGIQVESNAQLFKKLGAVIADTLTKSLAEMFTTGIREAKNFGEAIRNLALSVVDAIQQILAQELAAEIVSAGFKFLRGLISGGAASVPTFAEGGPVAGQGTATSDSIPAMLSDGEYVVRAAVVKQPGMLQALSAINAGASTPAPIGFAARRFAGGGLASGPINGRLSASLTVGLESGLVLRELQSPDGQRAVVRVISKNRRAAGAALGTG